MADQDSAFFTSTTNRINSANYHPAIWGDYFLTPVSDSKTKILQPTAIRSTETGSVAYHFTSEIEDALEKICHDYSSDGNDLYTAALWFRLLRQQGIKVSSDIFVKFKDSEGEFKESLKQDVDGMLSLYEAAHLGIRGEDILDEAIAFTTANLYSLLPQLSPHLAQQVSHALNRPIHKCLPRLEARHYIDAYKWDKSYNTTLLEFAKLDFNRLQEVHQKELNGITEWWKNLDFPAKLPYARDRLVECFFWSVGVYFEPQYSIARKNLAKVISMATILDDTYDNYATCEELELFTDAIERWDIKTIDTLPEYMKMIYASMLDLYNEIEESIAEEGRSYCVHYAKEAFEQNREHAPSSVECCMKQHGVSEEETVKLFREEIANAWKDINEEWLKPTPAPRPLLERIMNLARAMDVIYKDGDGFTNSYILKDYVASLLKDPVL
ncbi:hypothetical protein GH714_008495 [Hevea brasiliensis]|uniref:Uncharacterized protein n=1 Tax=Hevea brasiliensis TaxID=3981 RepID=A0A6A6KBY3_HEVBR|nr:hypothetical protein GH714_008495 [Hevea brasiliensis]